MEQQCPKCKDTGKVKEKDGSMHTCWDCLASGRLDQHSQKVRDSGVKI
ncbi:MAG: hypothetical protein V1886_02105 [archaeon]